MKVPQLLGELTGEAWTAVLIHSEDATKDKKVATRPTRLCEAVSESFTDTFVLPRELIHCPGACRSLDANWSHDDDLAHKISEKTAVPPAFARRIMGSSERKVGGTNHAAGRTGETLWQGDGFGRGLWIGPIVLPTKEIPRWLAR